MHPFIGGTDRRMKDAWDRTAVGMVAMETQGAHAGEEAEPQRPVVGNRWCGLCREQRRNPSKQWKRNHQGTQRPHLRHLPNGTEIRTSERCPCLRVPGGTGLSSQGGSRPASRCSRSSSVLTWPFPCLRLLRDGLPRADGICLPAGLPSRRCQRPFWKDGRILEADA